MFSLSDSLLPAGLQYPSNPLGIVAKYRYHGHDIFECATAFWS